MKKIYEKNELGFALFWIVLYCFTQSVANVLNKNIGIEYLFSTLFVLVEAVALLIFIGKNKLGGKYGICKIEASSKAFLYYIPLLVLASNSLWGGISLNYTITESLLRVLCMLCVGLVEEIIFRGLLFRALEKDSAKSAIIISSATFAFGHSINLFNGSGINYSLHSCHYH